MKHSTGKIGSSTEKTRTNKKEKERKNLADFHAHKSPVRSQFGLPLLNSLDN